MTRLDSLVIGDASRLTARSLPTVNVRAQRLR